MSVDEQDADYDMMTVDDFKRSCENRSLIDYDGFGDMLVDGKEVGEIYRRKSRACRRT